jgi:hypothetical protein
VCGMVVAEGTCTYTEETFDMRTALTLAIALFALAGCATGMADDPNSTDDALQQGEITPQRSNQRKVQLPQQPRSNERVDPTVFEGHHTGDREHVLDGVE